MQKKGPHILGEIELLPGDVILCYDTSLSEQARDVTGLGYSHAAICSEAGIVADISRSGVKRFPLRELLEQYSHAAVLRQPDCWNASRVVHLRQLIEQAIQNKTKFNIDGIRHFESRRQQHMQDSSSQLTDYFNGETSAPTGVSDSYFCSEFVAALYIQVGFVSPSAAVIYDPKVTSPAQLEDGTYGCFAGYLVPYEGYKIPETDEFYRHTPYHEIFNEPRQPLRNDD